MYKDRLGFQCRDNEDVQAERITVLEAQVAVLKAKIARLEETNIITKMAAEPHPVAKGPCSVCSDGGIDYCKIHGPTAEPSPKPSEYPLELD